MTENGRYRRTRENAHRTDQTDSGLLFEADAGRPADLDDMFKVLKDRHRRYALYRLADRSTVDLDSLLDDIAAREADRSERSDREETIRRLRTEFHHRHLPMLADAGLIEYDDRTGTLVYRGRWPVFERLLRTTRRNDPVAHE